jgi:hypothetical protein
MLQLGIILRAAIKCNRFLKTASALVSAQTGGGRVSVLLGLSGIGTQIEARHTVGVLGEGVG